ncbi:MAG: hypothetical protein GX050_02025 [Firmicutes bacterium]|nr:hypothetical protein [Bacillota bacterium]
MVTAKARDFTPEPLPEVRSREVKKVVINKKKLRRLLWIGGFILLLTMANAIIQALLAQQQFQLAELQSELKKIDRRIGWLQCELADHLSLQYIEQLALNNQEQLAYLGDLDEPSFPQLHLPPNPVLPPSLLELEEYLPEGNMVARITDWLSGLGRTLAGVDWSN